MPWTNVYPGVIEAVTVIIQGGTQSGIFVYSGTPASGDLIGSWAATGGTDAYGNAYPPGLAIGNFTGNNPTILTSLGTGGTNPQIEFSSGLANELVPATIIDTIDGTGTASQSDLVIHGPQDTTFPDYVSIDVIGSSSDGTMLAQLDLNYITTTGSFTTYAKTNLAGFTVFAGAIIAVHPGTGTSRANPAATETWQTPTLSTGWAIGSAGGTVQPLQYRLDPTGDLIIVGAIHTTSTTPSTTIFTLPIGYIPAITQRSPGIINNGGSITADFVEVNSSGSVSIVPTLTTSGIDVYFQVKVPLGTIA